MADTFNHWQEFDLTFEVQGWLPDEFGAEMVEACEQWSCTISVRADADGTVFARADRADGDWTGFTTFESIAHFESSFSTDYSIDQWVEWFFEACLPEAV